MSCKDRHEFPEVSIEEQQRRDERVHQIGLDKFNKDKQMNPIRLKYRQEKIKHMPVLLRPDYLDRMLNHVRDGVSISAADVQSLLALLFFERYGSKFFGPTLEPGTLIVVSGGYDDHLYIVKEFYFDGTMLAAPYDLAGCKECGEPELIEDYVRVHSKATAA